jgi:hypothetical protein
MTLKISEKANLNYLAKVVSLKSIRKHSNADKLQITTIDGNNIILGMEAKENDLYVYFSLESSINGNLLHFSNGFRERNLNRDTNATGFFESHGRVRAIKLRGEKSCGYVCPVEIINEWLEQFTTFKITETDIDTEFDTISDVLICEKYINREALIKLAKANRSPKGLKKLARETKLIDGQFNFHVDTEHLQKYIHKINPYDVIQITKKLHGTSAITGKILCKRKLSWKDSLAKYFGVKVQEQEYQLIWSSRKVVKNGSYYLSWQETILKNSLHHFKYVLNSYREALLTPIKFWWSLMATSSCFIDEKRESFYDELNRHKNYDVGNSLTLNNLYKNIAEWVAVIKNVPGKNHYYSYDLWRDVAMKLEDYLSDGLTFYGEVVGYTKNFEYIQKEYDYGCNPGEFSIYIYRITFTSPSGQVFEFSTQQVKEFCKRFGLNMVPEIYWGYAKDLFTIPVDDYWNEEFLRLISDYYLEKDCDMCVNKVPAEGIVLRKEVFKIEPYKFKSFAFKLRETKSADDGEIDMETVESIDVE